MSSIKNQIEMLNGSENISDLSDELQYFIKNILVAYDLPSEELEDIMNGTLDEVDGVFEWKPTLQMLAEQENQIGKGKRLFVDMDGTLAEFKTVDTLEKLYEKGYFLNLAPHLNVISAIKLFQITHPDVEVFILSAYLTDSHFALEEKKQWCDRYIPEIDKAHRIFLPCGEQKANYIEGGVDENDYLLDDYTVNLNEWEPPARAIKLLNNINGTKGTWKKNRIAYDRPSPVMAECIWRVMNGETIIDDPLTQIRGRVR